MANPISRPAGAHDGRGLDYTSPPAGGASYLKSHGYEAVARYCSSSGWKRLTRSEVADYHAHGIALLLNFEDEATGAKGGHDAGVTDAKKFISVARGLGLTGQLDCYTSVDWDVTPHEMPTVLNYLRGFASVLGKDHTGVYGSYAVVKAAHEAGVVKYLWQSYAWSGGKVYPGIHWYQYSNGHNVGGADADLNQIMVPASQWGAYGAPVTQTPNTPAPPSNGSDLLTPAEAKNLADALYQGTHVPSFSGERVVNTAAHAALVAHVTALEAKVAALSTPVVPATTLTPEQTAALAAEVKRAVSAALTQIASAITKV